MPHFFINSKQVENNQITIEKGENFTHIKSALRVQLGESLLFVDENYIQYETSVEKIEKDFFKVKIEKSYPSKRFLPHNIYLAQAVLKNDAQNYVIQKASELGIKGIYPLITDNCVIKTKVAQQKIPHWQKISYEASKQCERPDIAKIFPVNNFDFILSNKEFDHVFVFAERRSNCTLKDIRKNMELKKDAKILLVIGPEGGFSQDEFEKMEKSNLPRLTLGNLILRADTAVISAIATTLYELGY